MFLHEADYIQNEYFHIQITRQVHSYVQMWNQIEYATELTKTR